MKVAICQMSSGQNKEKNLADAMRLVTEARSQGAEVVVLPEHFALVASAEETLQGAESVDGNIAQMLSSAAKQAGVWIVGGTLPLKVEESRVANTMLVFSPDGTNVARYEKMHVFDVSIPGKVEFRESSTVRPGSKISTLDICGITSGLTICYDLRFPELFRLLALSGAKILFLPAAFTTHTGRDHWEVLLRARAIENQCFVVAANQYGDSLPGIPLFGRSMIIDPWGTVLATAPDGENVTTIDLDIGRVDELRAKLPSLLNRRDDIYSLHLRDS